MFRSTASSCWSARASSGQLVVWAPAGHSGFLTCIYAITKISYTYQIPMLFLITLRGAPGDTARYHVSNGLYLRSVIDAIDIPALYVERFDDLEKIGVAPTGTCR